MTHRLAAFALLSLLSSDPEPDALAFVGVHVLPMDAERVLRDQTVIVAGGRVTRLGPAAEVEVPPGATRIEGRGRVLLPGLVDAHVHCMDEGDLLVYLAHGITTVRNLKGVPWHLELRERIARGELDGPRFVTSGPFVNEPKVRTVDDVRAAVAEQHEAGYDCLKIHGPLSAEAYAALLEEGALAELPVVGHAPRNLALERVLELGGQVEISHAEEYLYTYFDRLGRPVDDEAITAIARASAEAGVTVTPNLVAYRSIVRQVEDLGRELARPEMVWVAPPGARAWAPDLNKYARDFEPADAVPLGERYALLERLTKTLAAAGVRLLAGSDAMNPGAIPGASLHEELELLVAAGMTPYQALRAATFAAGEFLGDGGGRIAVGAPADLVLVAENPFEDVRRARAIEGVLVRGRWLPKEELARRTAQLAADYAREREPMSRFSLADPAPALDELGALVSEPPEAFPFRAQGLESLVLLLDLAGREAAAKEVAELAAARFPERWTAWTALARLALDLGDAQRAAAALERALMLRPGDARIQKARAALSDER